MFITRAQWGAAAPRGTGNPLGNPQGVTVHWEGPKIGTRPHTQCAAVVRGIQSFHQNSRGWSDIAYNLLTCEHGGVFEGRGAYRGNAANGDASNLARYSICAIVGVGDPVTDTLKGGILEGVAYLRSRHGGVDVIDCHSDHVSTSCPGPDLRAWVKAGAGNPHPSPRDPASPIPSLPKPAPKPATAVPAFPGPTRRGSKGAAVRAVQSRFKARGWRLTVDGDFGPATDSVVRAFQREKRLAVDGVVGPNTWRAMWAATITK